MTNISKPDLVKTVAATAGLSPKATKTLIDGFLAATEAHLSQGETVQVTGFGTFGIRERKARVGVKPGTSEKVDIPASTYPAFKKLAFQGSRLTRGGLCPYAVWTKLPLTPGRLGRADLVPQPPHSSGLV